MYFSNKTWDICDHYLYFPKKFEAKRVKVISQDHSIKWWIDSNVGIANSTASDPEQLHDTCTFVVIISFANRKEIFG